MVGHSDYLAFDLLKGKMTVSLPSETISPDVIVKAIERTGMRAEIWRGGRKECPDSGLWQRRGRITLTAYSGLFALAGLLYSWALVGFHAALGSEGAGIVHDLPLPARFLYGFSILANSTK